jgi:hypothetical protein
VCCGPTYLTTLEPTLKMSACVPRITKLLCMGPDALIDARCAVSSSANGEHSCTKDMAGTEALEALATQMRASTRDVLCIQVRDGAKQSLDGARPSPLAKMGVCTVLVVMLAAVHCQITFGHIAKGVTVQRVSLYELVYSCTQYHILEIVHAGLAPCH